MLGEDLAPSLPLIWRMLCSWWGGLDDDDDDGDDKDGLLPLLFQYEGRGSNEWVYPSGEEYESFSRY